MEFIAGRSFNKQPKQLLQENDKLYEGMELHTKNIRFSPEHRDHQVIKQTHKIMMGKEKHRDGKDVLVGGYRRSFVFARYHIFAPAGFIERCMEDAMDDQIMAATNLFGKIINIYPFEDRSRRICRLILAHVLMQMKCCLFPVILSSFHRRGR